MAIRTDLKVCTADEQLILRFIFDPVIARRYSRKSRERYADTLRYLSDWLGRSAPVTLPGTGLQGLLADIVRGPDRVAEIVNLLGLFRECGAVPHEAKSRVIGAVNALLQSSGNRLPDDEVRSLRFWDLPAADSALIEHYRSTATTHSRQHTADTYASSLRFFARWLARHARGCCDGGLPALLQAMAQGPEGADAVFALMKQFIHALGRGSSCPIVFAFKALCRSQSIGDADWKRWHHHRPRESRRNKLAP